MEEVAVALQLWRSTVAAQSAALGGAGDAGGGPLVRSVQQWKANRPRCGYIYRFHVSIAYVLVPVGRSLEVPEAQQRLVRRIQPMFWSRFRSGTSLLFNVCFPPTRSLCLLREPAMNVGVWHYKR